MHCVWYSWILTFVVYLFGICTTALSVITSTNKDLLTNPFVHLIMLVLPIIVALLGTVSTRLRQPQKFAVAKMAAYEIVSEIYKFRLGALEYDGLQLAAALRLKEEGPSDKKKNDDLVAPIPAKEKNRLARRVFVERVQAIYTTCMTSELSKGTSLSLCPVPGLGSETAPARSAHR